jgi:DNA ligase-associated metallophosphoesterase
MTYVAGAEVVMRPSGALWLERDRVLVLADVHFEKGSSYAARGQLLPPYDTREALRRIALEVAALRPLAVVMLGDAFHDCEASDRLCREDAEALTAVVAGRTLVWVVGNHDPLPPRALPGEPAEEVDVGGLILRHEPTFGPTLGEAAGHLHPCARVSAGGRSVRRRCFVTDGDRLILPAFGAYAGGLSVLDRAFSSLFHRAPLIVALGARRAHAIGFSSVVRD